MTALVLGATGLIGSHTRTALSDRGLATLGTSTTGTGAELALDLTDPSAVDRLIADLTPEVVVNAAGMSSLAEAWQRPADNFTLNTTAVFNLLEALRRHAPGAHLVFTSSAGVYGPPREGGLPFTEDAPLRPASPYAAAKLNQLWVVSGGRRAGTATAAAIYGPEPVVETPTLTAGAQEAVLRYRTRVPAPGTWINQQQLIGGQQAPMFVPLVLAADNDCFKQWRSGTGALVPCP